MVGALLYALALNAVTVSPGPAMAESAGSCAPGLTPHPLADHRGRSCGVGATGASEPRLC